MMVAPPLVPVSFGELVDKITILEIKRARIVDPSKRAHVEVERQALEAALDASGIDQSRISALRSSLKSVNERLWQIEDEIRDCERQQDFSARFVALARSVYRENDRRAALKREINGLLDSPLHEEKSYRPY
ncbi:MAG: hypothetical protein KDA51_20070 [Planctomycetales bacterium]|nr:hypothetical protein [Planctomycetales bacterium]